MLNVHIAMPSHFFECVCQRHSLECCFLLCMSLHKPFLCSHLHLETTPPLS